MSTNAFNMEVFCYSVCCPTAYLLNRLCCPTRVIPAWHREAGLYLHYQLLRFQNTDLSESLQLASYKPFFLTDK